MLAQIVQHQQPPLDSLSKVVVVVYYCDVDSQKKNNGKYISRIVKKCNRGFLNFVVVVVKVWYAH
jgi:hypothetical protein